MTAADPGCMFRAARAETNRDHDSFYLSAAWASIRTFESRTTQAARTHEGNQAFLLLHSFLTLHNVDYTTLTGSRGSTVQGARTQLWRPFSRPFSRGRRGARAR